MLILASLLSSYIVWLFALTTILGTNGILNKAVISLGIIDEPLGYLLYGYPAIVVHWFTCICRLLSFPSTRAFRALIESCSRRRAILGSGRSGRSFGLPCRCRYMGFGRHSPFASSLQQLIVSPLEWSAVWTVR